MNPNLRKISHIMYRDNSLTEPQSRMGRGLSYLLSDPAKYRTSTEAAEYLNETRGQGVLTTPGFVHADFEELRKGEMLEMDSSIGKDKTGKARVAYRPTELCLTLSESV